VPNLTASDAVASKPPEHPDRLIPVLGSVECHGEGDHGVDGIASGPVQSPPAPLLLCDGGANVRRELRVASRLAENRGLKGDDRPLHSYEGRH
jgi:hypothetical protein